MYKIEKEKADDLTIFDSKFGGISYWDFSKEFPTDSKGEKLSLLAQINFDKEKLFVYKSNQHLIKIICNKYGINILKTE